MTRATAKEMELYGVLSPAASIGELMREADIAHVSNEVPFAEDCPPPQWQQEVDLVFCSDDKYIDLMREIGTDVVELTGDHFSDYGPEAMVHTLDMYDAEGWPYYGGGINIEEAKLPLKITHNGNKIAFLGCNAKAPGYATASETNPGALHCDLDEMVNTIQSLKDEGYQVIFTFQHEEIYRWQPTEDLIADFRIVSDAGATIVSGSQAHQPHMLEFYGDSLIHYGLGNLFFDQLGWFDDTNKAFIDRHVFYDGKYLGVELITVQFFNWSTPTLMTPETRAVMLERLFFESRLSQ
jgi:poly-gamma-glutamate synthesis protein (capsule biosynthesis protein)